MMTCQTLFQAPKDLPEAALHRYPESGGGGETFQGPVASACPAPKCWPIRPNDVTPLEWWRAIPADQIGEASRRFLRTTLDGIGSMQGRQWVDAMRGDPAASVAIALELSPIRELTLSVDLAMTALMVCAIEGNPAAAVVLSHTLKRTALTHPFGAEISASWHRHSRSGNSGTRRTSHGDGAAAISNKSSRLELPSWPQSPALKRHSLSAPPAHSPRPNVVADCNNSPIFLGPLS